MPSYVEHAKSFVTSGPGIYGPQSIYNHYMTPNGEQQDKETALLKKQYKMVPTALLQVAVNNATLNRTYIL